MPPDATVCAELERLLQKIRKAARHNLIVSVDNYEAEVIDKYYEEQFMKKDQSLRIPEKANMQEYSEKLETIVKRWGEEIVLLTAGRTVQQHPRHVWVRLGEAR